MNSCKRHHYVTWTFQVVAAAVLLQNLFFKFTAAEECVYIFTRLGVEPWGRIVAGLVELVAVTLLLSGRFSIAGALLSMGFMLGVIGSHLMRLGVEVKDDGGFLFALAWTVMLSSGLVVWLRRSQLPFIGHRFAPPVCDWVDRSS